MRKTAFLLLAVAAIVTGSAAANRCAAQKKELKEIALPAPDGKDIKLTETVKVNKYTLLDFWASWCPPCMAEVPYLTDAYAKYHDKGFEIYGVSYDKTREAWVGAIENKGLGWIHVSALSGWSCPTQKEYGVTGIPKNILFDSEGNVVARDLRGEDLAQKLAELLK